MEPFSLPPALQLSPSAITRLEQNLQVVREKMIAACQQAGRDPQSVTLVGVTKYGGPELAAGLWQLGVHDLAESRPQQLWQRAQELAALPDLRWHFVGHLQRNKADKTLAWSHLIQSGDSLRLLKALQESAPAGKKQKVLLEVNISGDEAKHGFRGEELFAALPELVSLDRLEICGLMGMAGLTADAVQTRQQFETLRLLRDQLQAQAADSMQLRELSMGMSEDFEAAILEGATLIRVGSALFEGLL